MNSFYAQKHFHFRRVASLKLVSSHHPTTIWCILESGKNFGLLKRTVCNTLQNSRVDLKEKDINYFYFEWTKMQLLIKRFLFYQPPIVSCKVILQYFWFLQNISGRIKNKNSVNCSSVSTVRKRVRWVDQVENIRKLTLIYEIAQ